MKQALLLAIAAILFSCSTQRALTKADFTIVPDSADKVLKGIITRTTLETDPAFSWLKSNMQYGRPDDAAVQAFREKKDQFSLVVFVGTWCLDTKNLLPKLYQLTDASGYPLEKVQLIAVDRQKQAANNLHQQYKVYSVPAFLVMKDGKEVGRVIEYGETGDPIKELGAIVAKF
jgi:thiol-disulfide isomerase/thioredoxin